MDVTALLNTSKVAGGQSKLDNMEDLFRPRTPWNAGGYSLPIHTQAPGSSTDESFPSDSLAENHIDQCRHKLSDSHSSRSSCASFNSISHSRISSISTVSSFHLPSQTISEAVLTDSDMSSHSTKTATGSCSPASPRTGRSVSQSSSSPALYGSSLALISERHAYGSLRKESTDQTFTVSESAKVPSADFADGRRLSTMIPRPASPSDAILIKRPTPPTAAYFTELPSAPEREHAQTYIEAPIRENMATTGDQEPGRLSIQTRGHKRAASAPDFTGTTDEPLQGRNMFSISSNAITDFASSISPPKPSLHPITALSSAPKAPSEVGTTPQDRRPCCMYIPNCDTGSQLRKAVSHIFGRNKMCTRRIPAHVWVWYCRKHYQRARYRNAGEWARTLQSGLVSDQIRRLQEWSDENRRTGEGAVVQDYRLAIRKREQKRLDARKPKGEREGSDSEIEEANESAGDASSSTAVPDWLLDLSGMSHDAGSIMSIVHGIQVDLRENELSAWPDIEILPNIITEQNESEAATGYTKWRSSAGAHGRSQSLGSGARLEENSVDLETSQGMIHQSDRQNLPGGISQKRKRSDGREDADSGSQPKPQSQRMRVSERQVADGEQGPQRIERPVFRSISEDQDAEAGFTNVETPRDHHRTAVTGNLTQAIATPQLQRHTSLRTAAYVEPGVESNERRYSQTRPGLHKHSQSDIGDLHVFQRPYRTPNRYRHRNTSSMHYDRSTSTRSISPHGLHISHFQVEGIAQVQQAHTRHQSTPIVPLSVRSPVVSPPSSTLPGVPSPTPSSSRDTADSVRALDLHGRAHL